jgi:hypothetical protein
LVVAIGLETGCGSGAAGTISYRPVSSRFFPRILFLEESFSEAPKKSIDLTVHKRYFHEGQGNGTHRAIHSLSSAPAWTAGRKSGFCRLVGFFLLDARGIETYETKLRKQSTGTCSGDPSLLL